MGPIGDDAQQLRRDFGAYSTMVQGYRRDGSGWKGICPLHADRGPSFCVYRSKSSVWKWRCFPCGLGGDIFDLKMKIDSCSFSEALSRLGVRKEKWERPPATERDLDRYRQKMTDRMHLPKVPWATDDFVILHCGCGGTIFNRPRSPAPFRRESIECPRCDARAVENLNQAGPPRRAGLYAPTDEGLAWVQAFIQSVREAARAEGAKQD